MAGFNDGRGKELAYVETGLGNDKTLVDSSGTPLMFSRNEMAAAIGRAWLSRPLVVMWTGNSVVDSYGSYEEGSSAFLPTSIPQQAMCFAGPCVRSARLSNFGTFYDRFGYIGHGGGTLDQIIADIFSSGWLAQLATDSVTPDIIAGCALTENDIATGKTFAVIKALLDRYVAVLRAIFPGIRIWLGTPLPSYSYDTEAKQQVARDVAQYMRELAADSSDVVCVEQGATYANAAYQPLELGYVEETAVPGTGTVHPQPRAAFAAGREWGRMFRTAYSAPNLGRLISTNPGLFGSIAATGGATGVTGTMPTSASNFGFAVPAGFAVASQALNPGWQLTVSQSVLQGTADTQIPSPTFAGLVPTDTSFVEGFARVQVIAGAENLSHIRIRQRLLYSDASNDFKEHFVLRTSDRAAGRLPDWKDGDELIIRAPRQPATTAKTIATVTLSLDIYKKNTLAPFVLLVPQMGLIP